MWRLRVLLLASFAFCVVKSQTNVTVTPNTAYYLVVGMYTTLSISGSGFAPYIGAPDLIYELFSVTDTSIVQGYLNVSTDGLASTDKFQTPNQPGLVYMTIYNDTELIFSSHVPVARIISYIGQVGPAACIIGESAILRQPIQTGQQFVGQIVYANNWTFYQWETLNEPAYHGKTYQITVDFTSSQQQPLGIFIRYTDVLNLQPPLIGYDPNGNQCPTLDCELLSLTVPSSPTNTCGFDARLLSCDNVKFANGTAGIISNRNCVLASDPSDPFTFTITSKLTRSGRYVIGVQGQGATPPASERSVLGYCSECDGFEDPVDLLFSISIVSSASTLQATLSFSLILCTLFALLN